MEETLLAGKEAKEWISRNNIKSPDTTKMISYQLDKMTTFYFSTEDKLKKFINLLNYGNKN